MNEKKIRRRLTRITVLVVVTVAVLLAAASIISASLERVLSDTMEEQMKSETEEYKINMIRKMDADMQTLQTLASFFEFSTDMMSYENFAKGVYEANEHNGFSRMGYFLKDGTGIRVMKNQNIDLNVKVSKLSQEFQEIIEKAWAGESGVSRIYYDQDLDMKIIAYAVPVYNEEEVVGVLGASTDIQVFEEILNNSTALYGKGYAHLVGDDGKFLIRSERNVIQEEAETIYDGSYLPDEEKNRIRFCMSSGKSAFSYFTYEGMNYRIYLEPLNIVSALCLALLGRLRPAAFARTALGTVAAALGVLLLPLDRVIRLLYAPEHRLFWAGALALSLLALAWQTRRLLRGGLPTTL